MWCLSTKSRRTQLNLRLWSFGRGGAQRGSEVQCVVVVVSGLLAARGRRGEGRGKAHSSMSPSPVEDDAVLLCCVLRALLLHRVREVCACGLVVVILIQ